MGIQIYPEVRGLIFDLDGTLSNSLPVHLETWNQIGNKYGFEFDPQIILEMTGMPTIEFARRVVSQYNISEEPQKIVSIKQQLFWDSAHLLEPIDEVVEIVKNYYGKIPMTVGTGASRKSAEVQLEALNLTQYFEGIVSASDVTRHKPEPETFLACAEIMGVAPRQCQVFEDGDLGIIAAQKAGMFVTDVRDYIKYGEWVLL